MLNTVLDLITASLVLLNAIPPGQVPSADESQIVFNALLRMLDQWNTQKLNLYTRNLVPYALAANKQKYGVGPGSADFNTARPAMIETAVMVMPGTTVTMPMDIITVVEFEALPESGVTGVLPKKLYCDYAFPVANLYVSPIPTGTIQMILNQWATLPKYAALTDAFSVPPGYEKAILYNLAINILPEFAVSLQPESVQYIAQIAQASKAEMQAFNAALLAGSAGSGAANQAEPPVAGSPGAPGQQVAPQ